MGVYSLSKSSIKNWVKYPNFMAGSAYLVPTSDDLITQTVLSSAVTTITFDVSTLAAAGYKHLQIRHVARAGDAANYAETMSIIFNSDSGTNYGKHVVRGNATSVTSGYSLSTPAENGHIAGGGSTASSFGASIIDILDFSSTNKNKTFRTLSGVASGSPMEVGLWSGAWYSTAAITSITIGNYGANIAVGSRFSLYGSKG